MQHSIIPLAFTILFSFFLTPAADANPLPNSDYDVFAEDVELRPGVTVDVHVKIYVDEDRPCRRTVFAVPGFSTTAATWEPLAEALFAENPTGPPVCRVAAIDLPARGGTSVPTNLPFSDLDLDDHVTAILGTLEALRGQGVRPRTIIGLSQGGLLVQMAQQRLLDEGSNLRNRFRIRKAVLLASALPVEIPWLLHEIGAVQGLISQFATVDPVLGDVIDIPAAAAPPIFFSNFSGEIDPAAPTGAEMGALGYIAPEPLYAALHLIGEEPFSRPSVDAGIFGPQHRTRLSVVGFEQDVFFMVDEIAALYEYLSGDANGRRLAWVDGPFSVHAMAISNPEDMLLALTGSNVRF